MKIFENLNTKEQIMVLMAQFPNDPHFIPRKNDVLWLTGKEGDGKIRITKSDKKSTYGKPLWLVECYTKE